MLSDDHPGGEDDVDLDDPRVIANYLIQEHGIQGAFQAVMDGIEHCNSNADFYSLSVWREVKKLVNPNKS